MIGSIGYGIACIVAGCLLTFLISLFRPIRQVDSFKAPYWILGLALAVGMLPYAVAEFLTRQHGQAMASAVEDAAIDAEIGGKVDYFKVLWVKDNKARVIFTADELNEFGTKERTVVATTLVKEKNAWVADDYNIVTSYQRKKDHTTFPPYW
ncbi:MAG: hypothetical protein Fur0036_10060 [Fimbriimonadaceae bacterium]